RWRREESAERLRVQLSALPHVEVEVLRRLIHRRRHELPHRVLLEELILPMDAISPRELLRLERFPERPLGRGRGGGHGREDNTAGFRRQGSGFRNCRLKET